MIEIINSKLPHGWNLERLNNTLQRFESGKRPKGGVQHITSGIPSIGAEHLTWDGGLDFSSIKYVPTDFYEDMVKGIIQKGDVLIVKDGATIGKVSMVRKNFPYENACINEHVFLLRVNEKLNNYFLFYYLFSHLGQNFIKTNIKGTTHGGINLSFFENVFIPFPSLEIQNQIVEKIEELFTKLDYGVNLFKTIRTQLNQYKQSVLKSAFEGSLTKKWREFNKYKLEHASILLEKLSNEKIENSLSKSEKDYLSKLPDEWIWIKLNKISEINPTLHISDLDDNCEFTYIPMRCVEEETGKIDLSVIEKLSKLKKGYKRFINGDIIFARITPCMENGKVAIAYNLKDGIGFGSTEFHVIRLNDDLPRKYYFYYLIQKNIRKDAQRNMTGTVGHLRVPSKFMKDIFVPFAPLIEQKKVIEKIDQHFIFINKVKEIVNQNIIKSNKLRQSILKFAFEGKFISQFHQDDIIPNLKNELDKEMTKEKKFKKELKQKNLSEYVK